MDEHDDHDHEKMLKDAKDVLKHQADSMMNSMVEAMAPMFGGAQLLGDEARAWDQYVGDFIKWCAIDSSSPDLRESAVEHADRLLDERRKRFNEDALKERMRGMLPSGKGLCNKTIAVDGKDTGHRCQRNDGHDGICY